MRDGERILFLDDSPARVDTFKAIYPNGTVVTTASDCIAKIITGKFTTVCLDHDLGGEVYVDSRREDCGMEVVRFLERLHVRGQFVPTLRCMIHSHNMPASNLMMLALRKAGYHVIRHPFGFGEFWNE